jgi:hypothetical protein
MPIQELSMSKRNYFGIVVVFFALALSAAALYRPQQTAPSPAAMPPATPTPTPPPALLGIRAYTDSPATDYYGDCFQQEGTSKKTLYFKVYAGFLVTKDTATLGLYHYKADGSLEPLQVTVKPYYYGNIVKLEVTDSAPPHLGPGPYEGVISAEVTLPGHVTTKATSFIYYDTYKSDYHECWHQQY